MPLPAKTLVIYAHPAPHRSRVNRLMVDAARALPHVTLHDLYATYPDFDIDVRREQEQLEAAELIVFQHPVMWYSMPSLLKEWVDVVLENGWAHGRDGTALHGKDFWLAVTTGGSQDSYREGGYHGREFSAFLPPFEQLASLCGMRWLPPYILHGAHRLSHASIMQHAQDYAARLAAYPNWCSGIAGVPHRAGQDWSDET